MGFSFGALGKALAFTAAPLTWVAARGVELVTGKDDIVRNNPLTYYKDIFAGSDEAKKQAPAGGANKPPARLETYGESNLSYDKALAQIDKLTNKWGEW